MLKLLLIVLCIILCLLSCNQKPEETLSSPSAEILEMESPVISPIPESNAVPETEEIPEPELPVAEPSMVDWTDFVKYDGQTYKGDWGVTTVPPENVEKLLGYIENHVPSEIWNFEEYTVPDNASPHHSIGTPLYAVADNENAVAVYDNIKNIYYLYQLKESKNSNP
ncbi:MAG: hypothetical protein IKU40_08815 [Clostridia bacterium]|nr:hypothetical protein [Clostridia bacterium]